MIDIRKLKELVRLMVSNDLTELDLRDSEEQVTLRRHGPAAPPQVLAAPPAAAAAPPQAATASQAVGDGPPAAPARTEKDGEATPDGHLIESPMVGTFYSSPDPDSPPFIKVGDRVEADTVVCLIEAMKIFNEIKAECSGTIEKVLVNNADAVEFGQPLFAVKPD